MHLSCHQRIQHGKGCVSLWYENGKKLIVQPWHYFESIVEVHMTAFLEQLELFV